MLPLFPQNSAYSQPPASDDFEISIIGPGFGEAVVGHVGDGKWFTVDSCVGKDGPESATLRYFNDIGAKPENVFLNAVTHWDDDHCRGLAELVKACVNAKVTMSKAFIGKDFLAYVQTYRSPLSRNARSGVKEIRETMEVLRAQNRTSILTAAPNRSLYAPGSLSLTHCEEVSISTLSPSDEEYDNFLLWVAENMPSVGETRRVAIKRLRNDLSIVLHISVGGEVVLLGGDLEEEGKAKTGWSAIIASDGRPTSKAGLFKVPHHGSETGHHPSIWTDLLSTNPVALVAPFRNGNVSLPKATDVKRILQHTDKAYVSTDLKNTANGSIDSAVQKTIREVTKSFTSIKTQMGMIRARKKVGSSSAWSVEMFGNAAELKRAR